MTKKNKDFLIEFDDTATLGELANLQLPDPTLVDFYKRLKNREIMINCNIDEYMVEWSKNIMEWNKEDVGISPEDRKVIRIYINSNGGCLNSIMELISVIKLSKTPVMTIGLGKCYSSGGLLLMGGHKGMRMILPTTEALVHDGSGGSFGDTGKVIDDLEHTKSCEEEVKKYVLNTTNITEKEYDKNYRRNWWMNADEIIQYGVADKIVTSLDEII